MVWIVLELPGSSQSSSLARKIAQLSQVSQMSTGKILRQTVAQKTQGGEGICQTLASSLGRSL